MESLERGLLVSVESECQHCNRKAVEDRMGPHIFLDIWGFHTGLAACRSALRHEPSSPTGAESEYSQQCRLYSRVLLDSCCRWESRDRIAAILASGQSVLVENYLGIGPEAFLCVCDLGLPLPDRILFCSCCSGFCAPLEPRWMDLSLPAPLPLPERTKGASPTTLGTAGLSSWLQRPPAASGDRVGVFLVFEGCDRSGKSTQTRLLQETILEKRFGVCAHLAFPNRNSITGQLIHQFLQRQVTFARPEVNHILFACNRWQEANSIRNLLAIGITVLCDRYLYSGVAYSVAQGIPRDDPILRADEGILPADRVYYLVAGAAGLEGREGFGDEVFEVSALQRRVAEEFDRMQAAPVWLRVGGGIEEMRAAILSDFQVLCKH